MNLITLVLDILSLQRANLIQTISIMRIDLIVGHGVFAKDKFFLSIEPIIFYVYFLICGRGVLFQLIPICFEIDRFDF